MSSLIKLFIGALTALSTVHAYPQQQPAASSTTVSSVPTPIPTQDNTNLIKDLLSAPTAVRRFQRLLTAAGETLLSPDQLKSLTVFSFNGAQPAPGAKGGATKSANIETFPILTDLGISTTVGFLNPCGINTPHVHPRATEFLTVVEGSIKFGYILENGLVKAGNPAEVSGTLNKFEGTVFPIGSIHYQFNDKCQPATFVASLTSEDPGTSTMAQNLLGLNSDVINATLGFPKSLDGKDINAFRKQIPANLAQAVDTCLNGCGLYPN